MDKAVIITVILVVLGGAILWGLQSGFLGGIFAGPVEPVKMPEGIILFYGEGCPHCEVVDEFINENLINEKVQFSNLEVWYDKDNQNILAQVMQKCNISANEVGVPFLYDGKGKCYIGDVDIINFFKNEANIQ